jgi:hypothetical protein
MSVRHVGLERNNITPREERSNNQTGEDAHGDDLKVSAM